MPNFIVCLVHFCELHGPCSIICTQSSQHSDDLLLKSSSKLQTCASCKLQLPGEVANLSTKNSTKTTNGTIDTEYYYISTQYPTIQARYTSLTKLIIKGLSVETTSDITKALYLGDHSNGYGLIKIFKIKDINARGGERKYGLMTISDQEIKILENWDIITGYLNKIIDSIQAKVANRITKTNDTNLNHEHYLRRSLVKPKSLIELTGDEQIFVKLHLSFTELIKDIQ